MEADKLKFTKITSDTLYHFKYDGDDYVLFNGKNENNHVGFTILYAGRSKFKITCLCVVQKDFDGLIRYKYNRRTLSSIDKEYFIEHLPERVKAFLV